MRHLLPLLVQIPVLLLLGFIALRLRKSRRMQEDLLERLKTQLAGGVWFRVHMSRPQAFQRFWKLQPSEARGVLILDDQAIQLHGVTGTGERIERRYRRAAEEIAWVGNPTLGSSNMHWFALGRGSNQMYVCADTGLNAAASRQASGDLFRNIAGNSVPLPPTRDFALEKNAASMLAVIVFFVTLGYAVIDGLFINQSMLIGGHLIAALAPLISLPFAAIGYLLLTAQRVPARESLALAMLCAFAISAAVVPVVKRIDQWLAPGGFVHYRYALEAGGRLHPADAAADLPNLDFSSHYRYWATFKPGALQDFELRRGGLGLWQLDKSPFNEKLRAFYEHDPAAK